MTTEPFYKTYSKGEQRADIAVHVIGVACGLVGVVALMFTASAGSFLIVLSAVLYSIGLIAMLSFSAAYNLWPQSPVKEMLRRLDHAAIFVMIAGTFTPLVMNRIGGAWGFGLLGFVWAAAIAGVGMKLLYPRRWERASIVLYIGLGLSILVVGERLASVVAPSSLILIAAGSVIYIAGVAFHLWERLPYQNAIWHWFVLVAAILHYTAVMNEVAAAVLTQ